MKWGYDDLKRCITKTLPDNSSIVISYEGLYLRSIKRLNSMKKLLYEHKYNSFDPNGHVSEESLINNLGEINTQHDKLERPILQTSSWLTQNIKYNKLNLVEYIQNSLLEDKNYEYDALNQITKENHNTYCFDSLGNPGNCVINDLNQISEDQNGVLYNYDLNGNLIEKILLDQNIEYCYDSLSRLKSITYPNKQKIIYEYDPLSRLKAKSTYKFQNQSFEEIETVFFLYDQDVEIGLIDLSSNLKQLKVLGLGLNKDIGASIAIEIDDQVFAPLHDFNGNIIAIISADGKIIEKYFTNAFGQEIESTAFINPWRYCSKRYENDLLFFGARFYDPNLQRWLTPDPSGFSDSSNLYVYVLNSPTNRLDLFGLFSEPLHQCNNFLDIPISTSWRQPDLMIYLSHGTIDGINADFVISCGHFHQLEFSPQEMQAGRANLMDHLSDLIPKEGNQFALVSVGNGICTSLNEFKMQSDEVAKEVGGTLCLSLYNPSNINGPIPIKTESHIDRIILSVSMDIHRTTLEQKGHDTPIVKKMRQFMEITSEKILKINPKAHWLHFPHSENGVITKRAIEKMNLDQQKNLEKMLHIYALGPAEPISKKQALIAENIYSEKDYITLRFAKPFMDKENYDIQLVPCISSLKERSLFIADHKFLGTTYRSQWVSKIKDLDDKYGFYRGEKHAETR